MMKIMGPIKLQFRNQCLALICVPVKLCDECKEKKKEKV